MRASIRTPTPRKHKDQIKSTMIKIRTPRKQTLEKEHQNQSKSTKKTPRSN
jgi:hypothetical protein